jgi:hypothetical protein
MNYQIVREPGVDLPEPDHSNQVVPNRGGRRKPQIVKLADDLGIGNIQTTASHHQYEDAALGDTHVITVNEMDVDPENVAESLRHRLGTQVDVNGSELTIHLLSAKIRRNLQKTLEELLQNDDMNNDNVYNLAA